MRTFSSAIIATSFLGTVFLFSELNEKIMIEDVGKSQEASVFFTQSTTSMDLRAKYNNASSTKKKLKVLIVPGHEPDLGGAEYLDVKERDLNADIALYLAQYLVEDGRYDVEMTRGKDGWNPIFGNYFAENSEEIKKFVREQKMGMLKLIDEGRVVRISDSVSHNYAPEEVALRLFGINKWANEHKVDIVIHVHFNDSAPRKKDLPGEYNGFAIYVPERQYSNAQASTDIAKNIFKRLAKMFPVSNLPIEDKGIVEDQDLIAVGGNNSLDAASLLVEYGYIYEPQFIVQSVKTLALKELAFQTYLGLADFFGEVSYVVGPHESTLLPYEGRHTIKKTTRANKETFVFQAALIDRGFYPPENFTRNDCPMSGIFGPCTHAAISAFQSEFEIKGENGIAGPKTRAELRKLFEPNLMSAR